MQYLANREAHLHFALLSDFTDAPTRRLGRGCRHRRGGRGRRPRAQRALRRGATTRSTSSTARGAGIRGRACGWAGSASAASSPSSTAFCAGRRRARSRLIVGDTDSLRQMRYVITLDADTVLPPDARAAADRGASRIRSTAPSTIPRAGRVVQGYGILQPRVGVSLPSAHRSRFAAIHSGHPGVDPYTTAVSDVYQDLYGEGSFTGKGIYDVDAFEQATHGRFPENTLLSHDLIEGSYARAGLATDIVVYDDYPTRYLTYTRRKHRWIRGDWQLLDWLTAAVPGPDGPEPNRLSLLSRWKILDNLRRSTVEIAQLAFLVAGWTLLPGSPLRWTRWGSARSARRGSSRCCWPCSGRRSTSRGAPTTRASARTRRPARSRWRWRSPSSRTRRGSRPTRSSARCGACSSPAATCSSGRPRRRPSGSLAGGRATAWRTMWPAVALAAGLLVGVRCRRARCAATERPALAARRGAWLPLVALWLASPAIAHALSAPACARERRLPSPAGRRRPRTRCSTGGSSIGSSPRRPTGSRRTTSRRIPRPSWRCGRRPPTSASSSSPRSAPTTWASSPRAI